MPFRHFAISPFRKREHIHSSRALSRHHAAHDVSELPAATSCREHALCPKYFSPQCAAAPSARSAHLLRLTPLRAAALTAAA